MGRPQVTKRLDYIKTGENIKNWRTYHGFSQSDLSKVLYVSKNSIHKWESGEIAPRVDALVEMVGLFRVRLEDLVAIETR